MKNKNNSWSFWKDIILKKDGTVNMRQLKKELSDFYFIIKQVPKVYCHITDNRMSKVNYHADTVIQVADECLQEKIKETVLDMIEDMRTEGVITQNISKTLVGYTSKYF